MSGEHATCVALLTPCGRGAVSSLVVYGPRAIEHVGAFFHRQAARPLADEPLGRILFGRWGSAAAGEEVVVCRREVDAVEVHCHGGRAAAAALIATLRGRGCQVVDWRELIGQTAADGIVAAARIALAKATTQRTATILWDQYTGALRRALERIGAAIDAGDTPRARQRVDGLLAHAPAGLHLENPWRVVLAGRPNVGKSSLINALCGYQRAIVHHTPGTTRDVVTAETAIDGWPVELADTAGLHDSVDPVEASGVRAAQHRLASADLVVLVFDASAPWSAHDDALANAWPQSLIVHNKSDKSDLVIKNDSTTARPAGLAMSVLLRQGIDELEREIARRLVAQPPARGAGVPFLPSQVALLVRLGEALDRGQTADALRLVAEVARAGTTAPTC